MGEDDWLEMAYEDRYVSDTDASEYGDTDDESLCPECGFPLDTNGDCGTDITHNY